MDLSSFYNQFREEANENVRILNDGLLALEQMPDQRDPDAQAQVHAIFRAMHTIKGSARLLGFELVGKLAHAMENLLGTVREGQRSIDRPLADNLLRCGDTILELTAAAVEGRSVEIDVDALIAMLEAPAKGQAPAAVASPPVATKEPQPASEAEDTDTPAATTEEPATPATPEPQAAAAAAEAAPAAAPSPAPTGSQTAAPPPNPPKFRPNNRQTVRVRVDRLDRLINLTGELVVGQQMLSTHVQALQDLTTLMQQQERALQELEAELSHIRITASQTQTLEDSLTLLFTNSSQARQILGSQFAQFSQHISQQNVLISDLEQEVMAARLLPISTVFATMPRAVRELAHAINKEVQLELLGETTEMDRKLLEAITDPLLHLVRNAVDHGIEPPDERSAAGKPRQGHIRISAEAAGGEVRICIGDDGRGMDPEKLRDVAVRKGLISAENVALLSDTEALELIFLPGFSSTPIITDISGRGVGMDVVRSNVGELGGQVMIESQIGHGTQIILVLPLTLVTTRILLVNVGKHTFALPATGCRGTIWAQRSQIRTIEGRATINHKEQTLPLLRLADLLGVEADAAFQRSERMPAVLIGNTQRQVGLLVDRLLDEREAVVKPLGPLFEQRRRYSGAVQLGDGQLTLLLNPIILSQTARGMALTSPTSGMAGARRRSSLLIADDSFTTRELIRSILQSAGYNVTVAYDGMDALEKLRGQSYDLVISDVEMPRVNGFQLTARIRQELGLMDLPVVIITSLASDEHRRQGLEAGAQAYIVKSQFNQDNLLEVVQQLLGH
jgi:two-component system, chemotaxis family, sensor kinase CheA